MENEARQSDDEPIDDASFDASSRDAALTGDPNNKACSRPKAKPAIVAADIQGLKYFKKLKPLLARLHGIGTERGQPQSRPRRLPTASRRAAVGWSGQRPRLWTLRSPSGRPKSDSRRAHEYLWPSGFAAPGRRTAMVLAGKPIGVVCLRGTVGQST